MKSRVGVTGLLLVLSLSACPKPSEEKDAGPPMVIVETRAFSAGPHGTGQFIEREPRNYTSMKLFVGGDESKVITGTYDGGVITFENVPSADNVIELRLPHQTLTDVTNVVRYETHRRDVYLEHQQLARADVALAGDSGTNLNLNLTGLAPWVGGDMLTLISTGAEFSRYSYTDAQFPPADGDTSVSGLTFNTATMQSLDYRKLPALVDSTKGDALVLLQSRDGVQYELAGAQLEPWDPWVGYGIETVASATTSNAHFVAGDTAQVTAAFGPLASTRLDIDFRSDTFAAARAELAMPTNARMSGSNSVYFEFGSGDSLYIAPGASIWARSSRPSQLIPEEPGCFPDFDFNCDAGCAACNNARTTEYRHPGNVTVPIKLTHPFTEPGTEMLSNSFRIIGSVTVPDAGTATLTALNNVTRPLPTTGPIVVERTLSAPRSLRFDDIAVPPSNTTVTALDNNEPTLRWIAPSLGTAKRYEVQIVEYRVSSPGSLTDYQVSNLVTTSTSAHIPVGVLVTGRFYMARVTAVDDPNQPDDLRSVSRTGTYRRAEAVTGLFTVP